MGLSDKGSTENEGVNPMCAITRFLLLLVIALPIPLVAHGQSTDKIDPHALYTDKDHPDASDANDGRYQEQGGSGPFRTIQALVNALKPGMVGYVKESSEPYFEDYRAPTANTGGVTFTKGGTPEAFITLSGFPSEKPIINQRGARSSDGDRPLTGFFIFKGSYIKLKNFELVNGATILTNPNPVLGEHPQSIIIEDMHIHHTYGGDNTGGVRIDNCENCIVRNSVIHDIYDIRAKSNEITSEPYGLHAGIHGYGPRNSIIEKNTIFNVKRGVYQKTPNDFSDNSNIVRQNIFRDVSVAYSLEVAGYSAPPAYNAEFYGNLVINTGTAVRAILHETRSQSSGLKIYNNTIYNTLISTYIRGITDVEFFNNIIFGSNNYPIYSERTGANEIGNETRYSLVDHNLYYNVSNIALLDRSGDYYYFNDLSSWQTAVSKSGAEHLTTDPGANSLFEDPLFVNPAQGNFHTLNDTVDSAGRGGPFSSALGVYGLFADVGADATSSASPIKSSAPKPPTLQID